MRIIAIFIFLLLSSSLHAQWFQTTATVSIIEDEINQARKKAIKKAVKDIILFSGVSIANLQQIDHSKIEGQKIILGSSGEIKSLEIIKEEEKDGQLTVNIKLDIIPNTEQCIGYNFPKSISLSRFAMNVPEQTVHGQIYDLHKQVSRILFNELSLNPYLFNMRHYIDTPLKLGEKYNNKKLSDSLRSLSIEKDSQFVIYGEVNDLSVDYNNKDVERYFYLTIYLYDALQGQLVFSRQYRQKSTWKYEIQEQVNTNGREFWDSAYGEAIINTLDKVNIDIAKRMQCIIPRARIISVNNNQLQINLGRRNGLKEGTLINLSYSSNFKDQFGIDRSSFTLSEQEMKVVKVHENNAVLATVDNYPLSNIQINDVALIKPIQ